MNPVNDTRRRPAQPCPRWPTPSARSSSTSPSAGWDGPVRVFALVRTAGDARSRARPRRPARRPTVAGRRARRRRATSPRSSRRSCPRADDLEDLLAGLSWPATVDGAAVIVERVVLPPAAEEAMPHDPDAALDVPAGPPRAPGRAPRRRRAARRAEPGARCAPGRTTTTTPVAAGPGPGARPGRGGARDAALSGAVPSRAELSRSQVGRSSAVAGADRRRSPRAPRAGSRSLTTRSPSGTWPTTSSQFVGRRQEPRRAVARRRRPASAGCRRSGRPRRSTSMVPGARDVLAVRLVLGRQLVDDPEREHRPGARPADVVDADRHVDRQVERRVDEHADLRAAVVLLAWSRSGRRPPGRRRSHGRASRSSPGSTSSSSADQLW